MTFELGVILYISELSVQSPFQSNRNLARIKKLYLNLVVGKPSFSKKYPQGYCTKKIMHMTTTEKQHTHVQGAKKTLVTRIKISCIHTH